MIHIEKLDVDLGDFRLKAIDLHLRKGECHALLGPSGSGKSTLISTLLGLIPPQKGQILLEGRRIDKTPIQKRGFGYLPQNLALFPHLSVDENIRYGIRAQKIDDPSIESHLQELVQIAEIAPLLDRLPGTLSGGERQRVALVRALAPRPELLLLDEPFSALDASLRRELWRLVKRIQKNYDTTMLLITHDLSEAFYLASQISVIIDGTIRQSGRKEEVFYRPTSVDVARYLGIRNIFEAIYLGKKAEYELFEAPSLGTELHLLPSDVTFCRGQNYTFAIRPEHIRLTEDDNSVNLLVGRVEIESLGTSILATFVPEAGTKSLEITLEYKKAERVKKESDEVSIELPANRLIVLNA